MSNDAELKKAVLYLRVSSEEQVENFSLETQADICRKEAQKRGYEVIDTFREEGKSAKTIIGRPTLLNLIEYCRKNKGQLGAVFIYRLDRISRQTSDYLAIRKKLEEYGVSVISATEPTGDTPTEKLVETMLAGFAQLDNDIRGERARNGLRARFLSGLISGKPPLGYILSNGLVVKDPETYDKVKDAWDLMATGSKSLADIAKVMNEWGLRDGRGHHKQLLRPQTTQRIFRYKFYMGIITSRKYPDEVKGQHVPMISEEQFYKVQAILDGRNVSKIQFAQRDKLSIDFPLRRIIRCSYCGAGLTASWSKGKLKKYGYYRCSDKCVTASVNADKVESTVVSLLKGISPKKEGLDLFIAMITRTYTDRLKKFSVIRQSAEQEIANLKDLRKTLVGKNLNGVYSDDVFKEQNDIIEEKMLMAQIAKDDGTFEKYDITAITDFVKTRLADLGETYQRSNRHQIKVLLCSVFPSGLSMDKTGTPNYEISPMYQIIRGENGGGIPLGGDDVDRTTAGDAVAERVAAVSVSRVSSS